MDPKKGRATRLEFLAALPCTFIIYESPLRLARTLGELAAACGDDREASVSREISKLYDTTERGTLGQLRDYYTLNQARGEIVLVVAPQAKPDAEARRHKNKYRDDDRSEERRVGKECGS